jgi:S-adenosylmethionine decarboxylase
MRDTQALRRLCIASVQACGLTAVGELFHRFAGLGEDRSTEIDTPGGNGITGVVLLAESHLAVHTWPEQGAVTLDVYVCNFSRDNSAAAQALTSMLIAAFAPRHAARQRWARGDLRLP